MCVQDYGYPQSTATETLKSYIYNEPETVEKTTGPRKKTVSGTSGVVGRVVRVVGRAGRVVSRVVRVVGRAGRVVGRAVRVVVE